jgi:hypothetical protein
MSHWIVRPASDRAWLSPDDVILRLIDEFGYVRVSREAGRGFAESLPAASGALDALGVSASHVRAHVADSFMLGVSDTDSEEAPLRGFLIAETPLLLSTGKGWDEALSSELLSRMVTCLGYVATRTEG